jgi:hypothetical protein
VGWRISTCAIIGLPWEGSKLAMQLVDLQEFFIFQHCQSVLNIAFAIHIFGVLVKEDQRELSFVAHATSPSFVLTILQIMLR